MPTGNLPERLWVQRLNANRSPVDAPIPLLWNEAQTQWESADGEHLLWYSGSWNYSDDSGQSAWTMPRRFTKTGGSAECYGEYSRTNWASILLGLHFVDPNVGAWIYGGPGMRINAAVDPDFKATWWAASGEQLNGVLGEPQPTLEALREAGQIDRHIYTGTLERFEEVTEAQGAGVSYQGQVTFTIETWELDDDDQPYKYKEEVTVFRPMESGVALYRDITYRYWLPGETEPYSESGSTTANRQLADAFDYPFGADDSGSWEFVTTEPDGYFARKYRTGWDEVRRISRGYVLEASGQPDVLRYAVVSGTVDESSSSSSSSSSSAGSGASSSSAGSGAPSASSSASSSGRAPSSSASSSGSRSGSGSGSSRSGSSGSYGSSKSSGSVSESMR